MDDVLEVLLLFSVILLQCEQLIQGKGEWQGGEGPQVERQSVVVLGWCNLTPELCRSPIITVADCH